MDSGLPFLSTPQSALIGKLYQAAVDGCWDEPLAQLCAALGWKGAALHACGTDGIAVRVGYRLGCGGHGNAGSVDGLEQQAPSSVAPGSESAQDHAVPRPRLAERRLLVVGAAEAWLVYRPCAARDTNDAQEVWAKVRPHLERAAAIALEQSRDRWRASQLERDADCTPCARIVLDSKLRVHYANAAARAMAAAGEAFGIEGGDLKPRRAADLAMLVAAIDELEQGREQPFVTLLPRRSGRWPYLARLTLLEHGARALYELVLIDREPPERACDTLMLAGFQLTGTEARVLALLIEGLSDEEIAARCRSARGTVKVHIRHVMAKLGVKSRSQLLRRVLMPWIVAAPRPSGVDAPIPPERLGDNSERQGPLLYRPLWANGVDFMAEPGLSRIP